MNKKKSQNPHQDIPSQDKQVSPDENLTEQPEPKAVETEQAANVANELEELKQKMQRLGADYHNYQKRSQKQIEQTAAMVSESIVKAIVPVLDNFEHALEKSGQTTDMDALLHGVKIVYDHLVNILEGVGMRRIEVKAGDEFNPSEHEALLHEESDGLPANAVVRELAHGYIMNGHTLRPAKVSVAKAPTMDAPGASESGN
jgi:molecular chaperone GrpE